MRAFDEAPSLRNAGMGESANNTQAWNTANTGHTPLKPSA